MSPKGSPVNAAILGIMAESALVDKETSRIYWEGGDSSTLSASLYPKVGVPGFTHMKTTILTSLLLLALVSFLAQLIRRKMDAHQPIATMEGTKTPFYKSLGLFVLQWTLLKTPNFDRNFVICVFLLYLIEAYGCSTRRYLTNAITSPKEVESFIEQLRNEAPVVTWKVRCFHYERRYWLSPLKTAQALFKRKEETPPPPVIQKDEDNVSGPFSRKVISHQATANYTFRRFEDSTIAGVWKRQAALSDEAAPFTKIILSKILLLANQDAKKDYFKQQSNFVTSEGMRDRYAEYSTNIEVAGFKRRMLAIRPVEGVSSAKVFRLTTFWVFTLLGLSLPYRIWFAQHCDKLRVTVVKETYAQVPAGKSSSFSSWFTSSKQPQTLAYPTTRGTTREFRQKMEAMMLYTKEEEVQESALNSVATLDETPPAAPVETAKLAVESNQSVAQESPASPASEWASPEISNSQQATSSISETSSDTDTAASNDAGATKSETVDTTKSSPSQDDSSPSENDTGSQ